MRREDSDGQLEEVCKNIFLVNKSLSLSIFLTDLPRLEVTGLMDLAGLKDLKLVLGVEWRLEWCGGRFGMNLRGGGCGVEGCGGLVCAVVSRAVGPACHWLSFWQLMKVSDSDLVELALLS